MNIYLTGRTHPEIELFVVDSVEAGTSWCLNTLEEVSGSLDSQFVDWRSFCTSVNKRLGNASLIVSNCC
jgi:hypothetical protein